MVASLQPRLVAPDFEAGPFKRVVQFLGTLYVMPGIGDENVKTAVRFGLILYHARNPKWLKVLGNASKFANSVAQSPQRDNSVRRHNLARGADLYEPGGA